MAHPVERAGADTVFSSAVASASGGVVVLDEEEVVAYNARFLDLWDLDEDEVTSAGRGELLDLLAERLAEPGDVEDVRALLAEAQDREALEELHLRDDRVLEHHHVLVRDDAGNVAAHAWFFGDVTEQHARATESGRFAELRKLAFAASHTFQSPLHNIVRNLQLLQRDLPEDTRADLEDLVEGSLGEAKRLHAAFSGFLAYVEATVKGWGGGPALTRSCLHRAHKRVRPGEGVEVDLRVETPLPRAPMDPEALTEVLERVFENAVTYQPPGTTHVPVRVGALQDPESRPVLYVRDRGIGIPERHHERVFRLFHRLHRANEYPGTGVGLSICRCILENSGGSIWVDARPGEGSTFYISFTGPRVPPDALSPWRPEGVDPPERGGDRPALQSFTPVMRSPLDLQAARLDLHRLGLGLAEQANVVDVGLRDTWERLQVLQGAGPRAGADRLRSHASAIWEFAGIVHASRLQQLAEDADRALQEHGPPVPDDLARELGAELHRVRVHLGAFRTWARQEEE